MAMKVFVLLCGYFGSWGSHLDIIYLDTGYIFHKPCALTSEPSLLFSGSGIMPAIVTPCLLCFGYGAMPRGNCGGQFFDELPEARTLETCYPVFCRGVAETPPVVYGLLGMLVFCQVVWHAGEPVWPVRLPWQWYEWGMYGQ